MHEKGSEMSPSPARVKTPAGLRGCDYASSGARPSGHGLTAAELRALTSGQSVSADVWYHIVNANSGLVLAISGARDDNGTTTGLRVLH